MAQIEFRFYSAVLERSTTVYITLPTPDASDGFHTAEKLDEIYPEGKKYPTMYLLHRGGRDSSYWVRATSVEIYAKEKGIMTVSPDIERSFGSNQKYGYPYYTYVTEELPRVIQRFFPSSPKREDNYLLGFSMGGFSVGRIGLGCPERFGTLIPISGAMGTLQSLGMLTECGYEIGLIDSCNFGFEYEKDVPGTENDVLLLAKKIVEENKPRPRIMIYVGTEDFGYKNCVEFSRYLTSIGLENELRELPGAHTDRFAAKVLEQCILNDL